MGVPQPFTHMKRIAVSAGLVALGVAASQASSMYGLNSMQTSKPWSIGASLRGFYDSNVNLAPDNEQDSFGFEISPTVGINLPFEQTLLTANYTYEYRYYDDNGNGDSACQSTHLFDASLIHSFTERISLELHDSFVFSEEPGLLDPAASFPGRSEAIRNFASVQSSWGVTPEISVVTGYRNSYYDYQNSMLSAFLDRMEHAANVDLRWQLARTTVGVFGYEFGAVGYLENDDLGFGITSEDRNKYSHKIYVGADHTFNPSLQGNARAGVEIDDYYNDPTDSGNTVSPWGQASLTYTYSADGSVKLGVSHAHNQTDEFSFSNDGKITRDQESTTVYVDLTHRITPKLVGGVTGRAQWSTFNGGEFDDKTDSIYGVAVNLTYNFNEHFSADLGYNYDKLNSDIMGREYDRSRVYLGVSAAY